MIHHTIGAWAAALLALTLTACGTLELEPAGKTERFTARIDGLRVSFDASSVPGDFLSWQWDFGDGTSGMGQAVDHLYERAGDYEVTLEATTGPRQVQLVTSLIVLWGQGGDGGDTNRPPRASFTASSTSGEAPLAVDFTSTATDPDGTIASTRWAFGDGATAEGEAVTYTFGQPGSYVVTLTVLDDEGRSGQAQQTIRVAEAERPNQPPVAAIKASPTEGPAPLLVTFASTSTDPDGTIDRHTWDFGDGETGAGVEVEHTYVGPGVYTVTLVVADDDGATSEAQATITVSEPEKPNRFPNASFTASTTAGPAPLTVAFTSTSTDPDGEIVGYDWDFGDGTTDVGETTRHVFEKPGSYTVTLVVTDDEGARSRAFTVIEVTLLERGGRP